MKKVLVHGSNESLEKFFSERLSKKKYNCLGILQKTALELGLIEQQGGGGLRQK